MYIINNRASSLWKPRTRHMSGIHDADSSGNKSQGEDDVNDKDVVASNPFTSSSRDNGKQPESIPEIEIDKSKSDELPAPLKMIFPGTASEFSLDSDELVEEDELVSLWLPGKIIHIYPYNGVYLASEVPKNFPNLRKIGIYLIL